MGNKHKLFIFVKANLSIFPEISIFHAFTKTVGENRKTNNFVEIF